MAIWGTYCKRMWYSVKEPHVEHSPPKALSDSIKITSHYECVRKGAVVLYESSVEIYIYSGAAASRVLCRSHELIFHQQCEFESLVTQKHCYYSPNTYIYINMNICGWRRTKIPHMPMQDPSCKIILAQHQLSAIPISKRWPCLLQCLGRFISAFHLLHIYFSTTTYQSHYICCVNERSSTTMCRDQKRL